MSKARGPMGHGHGQGMSGEKAKDFKNAMKRLFQYMKRYRIQLGIMMIFAVGSTIFNIIGPKILPPSFSTVWFQKSAVEVELISEKSAKFCCGLWGFI